jgi:capsular exopolysaccharide synthesis family protein
VSSKADIAASEAASARMFDPLDIGAATRSDFDFAQTLRQYWRTVLRWRLTLAGLVAGCLAVGVIVTLMMPSRFTATVKIQIDRNQKQVTNVAGLEVPAAGQEAEFYATQYALLGTRVLAERVANDLGLARNDAFLATHGIDPESLRDTGDGVSPAAAQKKRRDLVVNLLLANVTISPVRASKLVDVDYTSRDAAMSARIANQWASAFIAQSMDREYSSTAAARRFLEQRIDALRRKVEESEQMVILNGSRSGLVALDQVRDADGRTISDRTLASADVEQLSIALNQATADRIAAMARSSGKAEASAETLSSPVLSALRADRTQASAKLAAARMQYGAEYPTVAELSREVDMLDAAIARETARIGAVHENAYRQALVREEGLKARVAALKADLDRQNRAKIRQGIYQREADTNRQLYDALLQRYKEIGVAGGVGANNISVADPAIIPPSPSSPNLPKNLAIALLLGLACATVATVVFHQFDQSIREASDVQTLLGLPLLGATPQVEPARFVTEVQDPKSDLLDAVFSIRSSLAYTTSHGLPRSIAVISSRPSEGKSSTAFALAAVIGRTGKRALLVDADMRWPSVHQMAEVENGNGLSEYLAGDDAWQANVRHSSLAAIDTLPAGRIPPSAAELLSGDRFEGFVRQALERYDHVVIDCPPVMGMPDAPLIARAVEGAVYVVEYAGVAVRDVQASLRRLSQVNGRTLGVVLTKVREHKGGYSYGYGQHYAAANAGG